MLYYHPLMLALVFRQMIPFSIVSFILNLTVCYSKMTLTPYHYRVSNLVCFSPAKSVYMRITRKYNPIICNYSINSTLIEDVQATTYLGLTITKDLTWSTHVNNITSKALSDKAFLQRNLESCPTQIELKCFSTMIRSNLEYALVPSHKEGYRKVGRSAEAIYQIYNWKFFTLQYFLLCLLV